MECFDAWCQDLKGMLSVFVLHQPQRHQPWRTQTMPNAGDRQRRCGGCIVFLWKDVGPGLSMFFSVDIPSAVFFKYQIARVPNESQEMSQVEQIERHAETNLIRYRLMTYRTQLCRNTLSSRQFASSMFHAL